MTEYSVQDLSVFSTFLGFYANEKSLKISKQQHFAQIDSLSLLILGMAN